MLLFKSTQLIIFLKIVHNSNKIFTKDERSINIIYNVDECDLSLSVELLS